MAEISKGIPQVGMRFRNLDEAWAFWDAYGGRTGFDVRKRFDKLRKGRKPMKIVAPTQKGAKVSCLCNMSWLLIPKLTS
jgi:hypothetical protein